jgi:hypothetical protein
MKVEVLRYLGYRNQNLDPQMEDLIESCIKEIQVLAVPRYTYKLLDIEVGPESVKLINTGLEIGGKSIACHLQDAKQCAIFAATLGSQVDKKIQQYQVTDMTRGVVLDSCATAKIESLCDEVDQIIRAQAADKGLGTTSRFSPGYGDCSLENQPAILKILDASNRIGLSSTKQCLLLPKKSVTAVLGLIKTSDGSTNKCDSCQDNHCEYRRG